MMKQPNSRPARSLTGTQVPSVCAWNEPAEMSSSITAVEMTMALPCRSMRIPRSATLPQDAFRRRTSEAN